MMEVRLWLILASRKVRRRPPLIVVTDRLQGSSVGATDTCRIATVIIMHSRRSTRRPTDTSHNHTCKEDHLDVNPSIEIRKDAAILVAETATIVTKM